jgi:hypothetical protein
MGDSDEDHLEKIHVDLPDHWAAGGESMWAKPLGKDEYELRNTPFYAYGLNRGDIVRAYSDKSESIPVVAEVLRPSGNKTLRIFFEDSVDRDEQISYLDALRNLGLHYERATDILVALDIERASDYDAIVTRLWELEASGVLEYETCEATVAGRFDEGEYTEDQED